MQPLSLTLKGFRGIRDGLGRDVLKLDFERLADGAELVAIAGANGRGKTTVMDNMHPYLTMPSRAAMAGPGGFSYYDHVCMPENEKDLIWAHDGRSYRSQVVIRVNGRRKTEAFLLMLADDGAWKPVVLDDGTVSDGKVDTYTRCVEALCGSADTFFTSVFSAQGKRQLPYLRASAWIWNQGTPIGIPSALTSAERATTQPSLFDSTTTGRSFNLGSKSFSQDA